MLYMLALIYQKENMYMKENHPTCYTKPLAVGTISKI